MSFYLHKTMLKITFKFIIVEARWQIWDVNDLNEKKNWKNVNRLFFSFLQFPFKVCSIFFITEHRIVRRYTVFQKKELVKNAEEYISHYFLRGTPPPQHALSVRESSFNTSGRCPPVRPFTRSSRISRLFFSTFPSAVSCGMPSRLLITASVLFRFLLHMETLE